MLLAVVEDLARGPSIEILTTWDARLPPPVWPANASVRVVAGPDEEFAVARELAATADATWIIAPETGGTLRDRVRSLIPAGGRRLNCSPEAIDLCADKLRLAAWLAERGIPTPTTCLWTGEAIAAEDGVRMGEARIPWPIVVKPRDGAGSQSTFVVEGISTEGEAGRRAGISWPALKQELARSPWPGELILQPFLAGRAVSIAAIVWSPNDFDLLPIGEQRLSRDGRLTYQGGRLPSPDLDEASIRALVTSVIHALPGLYGWVGFDVLLPDGSGASPVLIEINPRLTTSYIGYRQLADRNLALRIADPDAARSPLEFRGEVAFSAEGMTTANR